MMVSVCSFVCTIICVHLICVHVSVFYFGIDICKYNMHKHKILLLPIYLPQHASADVERMVLGNKCDVNDKRQVSKERGEKVGNRDIDLDGALEDQ